MCGIVGIFGTEHQAEFYRERALKMSALLRHRGPDWSGIFSDGKAVLTHERLAIVDPLSGAQPLKDTKTGRVLCVNGEIYNHLELRKKLKREHDWQTKSDCEIIMYLYEEYGPECVKMLSGIFAFVLYDPKKGEYFIARDHMGICPLYWGWDDLGILHVASEMKALDSYCKTIEEFPPGSYFVGSEKSRISPEKKQPTRWYAPVWAATIPVKKPSLLELREALGKAVQQQLMSDVPYGVLISGGLDSSLIAALACKFKKGKDPLHSFAVGLKDSPDLKFARKVAEFLGTVHHEIIFTIQEGMDALRDVIYHLETFDVTTIRAATPMYLMARKIK